jgi:hypothetical protein
MTWIFTRKRGKPGISLYRALTAKNHNGIHHTIRKTSHSDVASGSYGSVYLIKSTNIVFKKHDIVHGENDLHTTKPNVCTEWEHEYQIHKLVYNACNNKLKKYDICIAKPYTFRYVKTDSIGLIVTNEAINASSCIYTMDYISPGSKLDKYLLTPVKSNNQPPYLYLGTLNDGINRISLRSLKDAEIITMPNDAYSFCKSPGKFGLHMIHCMIHSFFIIIENGFMPRDIEYILDGRKRTQTFAAIVDFNQVRTIQERSTLYGDGYDVTTDIAHVYIDLCGLRNDQARFGNPMAPYDQLTSIWKFLCNPLTCPSVFLNEMQPYRDVANIILDYAFVQYMKPKLSKHPLKNWKPLYVYAVSDISEVREGDTIVGKWTEQEYCEYRNSQCVFHSPFAQVSNNKNVYIYVESYQYRPGELHIYDRFVEFDIQFQHYILSQLHNIPADPAVMNGDFFTILTLIIKSIKVPETNNDWSEFSLF